MTAHPHRTPAPIPKPDDLTRWVQNLASVPLSPELDRGRPQATPEEVEMVAPTASVPYGNTVEFEPQLPTQSDDTPGYDEGSVTRLHRLRQRWEEAQTDPAGDGDTAEVVAPTTLDYIGDAAVGPIVHPLTTAPEAVDPSQTLFQAVFAQLEAAKPEDRNDILQGILLTVQRANALLEARDIEPDVDPGTELLERILSGLRKL